MSQTLSTAGLPGLDRQNGAIHVRSATHDGRIGHAEDNGDGRLERHGADPARRARVGNFVDPSSRLADELDSSHQRRPDHARSRCCRATATTSPSGCPTTRGGTATLKLDGPGCYWLARSSATTRAVVSSAPPSSSSADAPPEARLDRPVAAAALRRSPWPATSMPDIRFIPVVTDGVRRPGTTDGPGRHLRAILRRPLRAPKLVHLLRGVRRARAFSESTRSTPRTSRGSPGLGSRPGVRPIWGDDIRIRGRADVVDGVMYVSAATARLPSTAARRRSCGATSTRSRMTPGCAVATSIAAWPWPTARCSSSR